MAGFFDNVTGTVTSGKDKMPFDSPAVIATLIGAFASFLVYLLLNPSTTSLWLSKLRPNFHDSETFKKHKKSPVPAATNREFGSTSVIFPTSHMKMPPDNLSLAWKPDPFTRPTAPPYPNWSLQNTKPLPFRPFRWGPKYAITMGLRKMDWDEWIELDNEYLTFHEAKKTRIAERGAKCCRTDLSEPRFKDGAVELLEELAAYLPERYPDLFRRADTELENKATGETIDVRALTCNGQEEDPMQLCARLIQDDLAIMFEGPDGQYYLRAGAILLAGFWRLEDKFGMPLSEIHTSGDVPGFKEKLEKGMMSFFRRIKPDSPVLRNNYFIQVDPDLAWSRSIGDEDSDGIGWYTAEKNKPVEEYYFRSERQSLRRLPRSGGVVFTIRTYFHPITELAQEEYIPGRLASAVRSWGPGVSHYKGKDRYEEVLLPFLDRQHRRQVEKGLDMSDEGMDHEYPW